MTHDHAYQHQPERRSSRGKWVLIGFLAVGVFFLLTEHRAHLFGWLPFLLVLACPLMHLFHGHGGHGGPDDSRAPASGADSIPHNHQNEGKKS